MMTGHYHSALSDCRKAMTIDHTFVKVRLIHGLYTFIAVFTPMCTRYTMYIHVYSCIYVYNHIYT